MEVVIDKFFLWRSIAQKQLLFAIIIWFIKFATV